MAVYDNDEHNLKTTTNVNEVKQPHSVKESLPISSNNAKKVDNNNKSSSVCSLQ